MNARQLDPIAEAAIDWLVRLDSGTAGADDHAAFARWLHADPRHEAVWRTISGLLDQPLAAIKDADTRLPGQRHATHRALTAPARRKALRRGTAMLLLLGLSADVHTATGERRQVQLADGSTLILNARSAVDIEFSAQTRLLRLRRGTLLIHTAADRQRPLIVATEHGEARALGTRFAVQLQDNHSELAVLEHSVRLTTADGSEQTFAAGSAARYDASGIHPIAESAAPLAAWADGQLDVRDRPLAELIAALRPYKRGYLQVSPQAAVLRVFGVFPLDDPDATLHALAETQPIAIRRYGPWLTVVEHQNEIR